MSTGSPSFLKHLTTTGLLALACAAPNARADQVEVRRIDAPPSAAGGRFGESVDIDGSLAVVGAFLAPGGGTAWLVDVDTGEIRSDLTPPGIDPGDGFGFRVSIAGSYAIVGSSGDDDQGLESGAAYVFDISDPDAPMLAAKLLGPSGGPFDFFGSDVAVDGDIVVVGASGADDAAGDGGAAYAFKLREDAPPILIATLLSPAPGAFDLFGTAVDISGTTAIVGSPFSSPAGVSDAGAAYLFDVSADATEGRTSFAALAELRSPAPISGGWFGTSVAIHCDHVVVGSIGGAGRADLFERSGGPATQSFLPPESTGPTTFGRTVGLSGGRVMVAAPATGATPGSAVVYDIATGDPLVRLVTEVPAAGDGFGAWIAIDGVRAIAGAPTVGDDDGAIYVYAIDSAVDVDGDGTVGFGDLLRLIAGWGLCPTGPVETDCPADIDGDGAVTFSDLCQLLAAWN